MKRNLAIIGLGLVVVALACNAPLFGPTAIPVSTEAAGQLVETLTSITPGPSGEITVSMTQEQLTSFVAIELAKTPEVPIKNPQIALDNGTITLTGQMDSGIGFEADVEIDMTAEVGADGKPDVTITSAQLGPLPVPQEVLDGASDVVSQSLADEIDNQAGVEVHLDTLTIDDGVLTATGTVQQ
jgi:uncharacterized protein YpmS